MGRWPFMAVWLVAAVLPLLLAQPAWAQSSCATVENQYRKVLGDLLNEYKRSAQCQQDKALLSFVNGQLSSLANVQNTQIADAEAIKIKAEVKHDHEKFIFGSRYYLRLHIRNDAAIDYYIRPDEVVIHVPSELVIDPSHTQMAGTAPPGPATGSSRPRYCSPVHGPTETFDGKPALRVPRGSDYVIVWDCPPEVESWFGGYFRKLLFRPDQYTFVVNVPFRYTYDTPTLLTAAGGGTSRATSGVVSKIGEAKVGAELDGFFVSTSSIVGALIAVLARACLQLIENYALRKQDWPHKYQFERRKVLVESLLFAVVAFLLPPLLVAGANVTQKFDHGVAIKIFDFFGAALAGFLVQMLIMKLGQPAVDKLLSHQP